MIEPVMPAAIVIESSERMLLSPAKINGNTPSTVVRDAIVIAFNFDFNPI